MKLVVVLVGALALLVAAAAAQGVVVDGEDTTVVAAFRDFAVTFKKKYSDDAAERKALDTFRQNQLVMAEHQRLNPLATFGVTQFSDMTQEEFATLLGTAQPPQPRLTPAATTPAPAPKSCDWRSKGGVTPVLDQGMCGSSAAHSIVGSSEGVCFAKSADLIALSVHELECGTNACSGASQEQTYNYIMRDLHGHMATAASFPRTTCNVSKTVTGCTLKSYSRRWIDFQNDYKTLNLSYMESVWWAFHELWEKQLVYRGFKVMPFSTACTTPLSNFECNMNYKDVSDPSVVITFPMLDDPTTHFLAWTTTPWTLPSNLALCVNNAMDYVTVEDVKTHRKYVLAECRLEEVYKKGHENDYRKISVCKGKDLVGKQYVPLFPYFQDLRQKGAFRVIADDYVTNDSGVGIVHCAPGFGEEDFRVCIANHIIEKGSIVCPVDENGCFTAEVHDFAGKYIKECDDALCAMIKAAGRLVSKASIVHSYPFCWRSDTPLIYKAVDAWFVKVESFRDKLLRANSQTYWVPDFVKTNRFTNWLEGAVDWNVSRNRYWGCPLPVWHSEDWQELVCVGSVAELERLSGRKLTDIHREFVDDITIPSKRPGQPPLKRVEQVFDCWFESGSMPYGQQHYPFENREKFEAGFPADFIAEGLDQTRGWFYTLLVLSTALFDKPAFKNLIVNGLVLAEDGKKMSKRLKNYPEVMQVINQHSADALRLYLISSPAVRAEPLRFREQGVKDIVKDVFLPWFNAVKFFIMHASRYLEARKGTIDLVVRSPNDMDRWITAATQTLVQYVHAEMASYHLYTVVPAVINYMDKLTNWYVRMNRRRLKGNTTDEDWGFALCTLFQVFISVTRILAPFVPFMSEVVYQRLKGLIPAEQREESVHFVMVPEVDTTRFDDALERSMDRMIKVIDLLRVLRDRTNIPIKKPIKKAVVIHPDARYAEDITGLANYIKAEMNCFELVVTTEEGDYVVSQLEGNMAVLGKRLKKEAGRVCGALKALSPADVRQFLRAGKGTVAGQELTMEDVKVTRSFCGGIKCFETNTDNDVLVLMDTTMDEGLINAWKAREFVNRVQQLRKKAGLVITDVVKVFYQTPDDALAASIKACEGVISQTITGVWSTLDKMPADAQVIARDETDIDTSPLVIVITKL